MWRPLALGAGLLAMLTACASTASHVSTNDWKYDAVVLTRAEMSGVNAINAYEAVSRLRPQYLRRRGETSVMLRGSTQLHVYMDNMRLGGMEALHYVSVEALQSIRYMSAAEATMRWGVNHTGGALLLSSIVSAR